MNIDLIADIKERIDLAQDVIIPDIGEPKRQGRRLAWVCPFHPDRNPSLYLNPDGQSYRCFGCDARGDAFTWVMAREGWGFRETLDYLAGLMGLAENSAPRPVRPARAPLQPPDVTPPAIAWQTRGRTYLERAQAVLWENAGAVGLTYLHGRGLADATIKTWGVGWCPQDVYRAPKVWGLADGKNIYFPRGVVIPHQVDGELWALKVRRFVGAAPARKEEGGKYGGPRGGSAVLYGVGELRRDGRPLVIVEAELDALLLWQEAGDLVDVVALAGAGRQIPARWLVHLLAYPRIFAALDADGTGALNNARLLALSERITVAAIPIGNDLTEYYQQGGDIRNWAATLSEVQASSRR